MDPFRHPQAYFSCRINGIKLPGKCVFSGANSANQWDVVQGQGTDGASVKGGAKKLDPFSLFDQLWLPEHFDFFDGVIRPMLERRPTGKEQPKALEVEYPELAKLGILRVVKAEIGMLETVDDTGLFQYPIKLQPYVAPKPAPVLKAKGDPDAPGAGEKQKAARAKTANEIQIERLTAKLNEEANK